MMQNQATPVIVSYLDTQQNQTVWWNKFVTLWLAYGRDGPAYASLTEYMASHDITWPSDPDMSHHIEFESEDDFTMFLLKFS